MLNRALILLILPVFGIGLFASDDASFPPVVYKSSADLMAALAKSIETRADQALRPSPTKITMASISSGAEAPALRWRTPRDRPRAPRFIT
jgi:hypothetical protein